MPIKKKEARTISFSEILRGLQQAINSAQDILQAQQVDNVLNFFGSDGHPVSQKIQVGEREINVPLIAIVPHNSLTMEDVEIKFKTKVDAVSPDSAPNSISSNGIDFASANLEMQMNGVSVNEEGVMEVTIRFKAKETPEALSRILDEYNKQI